MGAIIKIVLLLLLVQLVNLECFLADAATDAGASASAITAQTPEAIAIDGRGGANYTHNYDLIGYNQKAVDAEVVEVTDSTGQPFIADRSKRRSSRQLFYNPNMLLLQGFGQQGDTCFTSRGIPGLCVRLNSCQQAYYRRKRQLTAAVFTLNWPAVNSASLPNEICTFYDQFGRANTGICCTNNWFGDTNFSLFPVRPVPAPPLAPTEPPRIEPVRPTQEEAEGEDIEDTVDLSPDFVDENNVENGEGSGHKMPPAVTTYDDYRYQWANQFGGINQWPPPIPTHPPSTAVWPPPIPTHPPNHHYPTHPPSTTPSRPTTAPTTKRTTTTTTRRPTTIITTRRPTHPPTTTTRRPMYPSYPGYPGYPSYPSYPMYPTHKPTTTRAPTTTTRRPTTIGPTGSGSTDSHGLPTQCGIKNPVSPDQERIVGGTNASPHEFPWIAVLFKSGKQFCGGSLITRNHILTAAHCVARMTSWDVAALTAHLGDYNIRTDFEVQHQVRRIKRLVRHKGFDFSHLHNDVAVLTLNEPVKFTHEIQPICLPTSSAQQGRSYSGQLATVAGWGSLRENGPQPSILQKVQIPIWSNSECARKYGHAAPGGIIESMICAGQAAKDSCSGDSGGPMIVNEGGRYLQVGIVSWGIGCGKGQYPGVYTRITSLLPWIYKNIK